MISIVVPCYNCEKTFDRCLECLRKQTQANIEIILVDDGSIDGTGELCNEIAEVDTRVKVVHQSNRGLMNAWKRGVVDAAGEYIAFCDADDYIDEDLIETLETQIEESNADMILYDMIVEYEDGTVEYLNNRLKEGFYSKEDIDKWILPQFFFNGDMQSEVMHLSRCTKVFRRELLTRNFQFLDDKISNGEDDLTTFATVLSADSLFCMKNYYPYHYVRNNNSMIGRYDSEIFLKFLNLRNQIFNIASVYQYKYKDQIDAHFLSNVFLCMKKEICRNKGNGYFKIRIKLKNMRENSIVDDAIHNCSVRNYRLRNKIFAYLIMHKQYFIVYIMTQMADKLGIGKA